MSGLARFVTPRTAAGAADLPPALQHLVRPERAGTDGPACELCGVAVGPDHRHVVELASRTLQCTCRGCALLFPESGAGAYRAVPERVRRIDPFVLDPRRWAALAVPVGIAFVLHDSRSDTTSALYPSPAGATEAELPADAWAAVVADNPELGTLAPDVEAALVRTDRPGPGRPDDVPATPECHVVPVDRCYALVGTLRLHWRGFDGGAEVRDAVRAFFADLHDAAGVHR